MTGSTDFDEPSELSVENPESFENYNSWVKSSTKVKQALANKDKSKKWIKIGILFSLSYTNFWTANSVSIQAPFFPREAEMKGATPTQYGLVFGIFQLVVLLGSLVFGKLITRVTPKFLITSGALICGISCVCFGMLDLIPAGPQYIGMAFVIRILEGLGAGAVILASFTILAVEFPTSMATSFSLCETALGCGLIVGPTLGGALYQAGGFKLPFVVNGIFVIIGSGLLAFLLPKSVVEPATGSRNLFVFLFNGGILCYALSITSSNMFLIFNDATLEPHLRMFNLSPMILGLIFVIVGGTYATTTPIWGLICDKGANPLHVTLFGYSLTCLGMFFLAPLPFLPFEPKLWTVILSLLVIGLGLAAKLVAGFVGCVQNTIGRGFPDNISTFGMVSAFFSTAASVGGFIGPSLGGFLLDTVGYSKGTVVIFLVEIFCMCILFVYMISTRCSNSSHTDENECLLVKPKEKQITSNCSSL